MRNFLMVGLILATFVVASGGTRAAAVQSQSGDAISLQETAEFGTPTGVGAVELLLDPVFSGVGYANVVIDLDGDGLEPSTDDWWVQNFPAVLEPTVGPRDNVAFTFDLGVLTPTGSFDVYASFTSSTVGAPSLGSMVLTLSVPFDLNDIGGLQAGRLTGLDAGIAPAVDNTSSVSARLDAETAPPADNTSFVSAGLDTETGPAVQNMPLALQVIGRTRLDIPGIKQETNECAPTAAAQSLLWLKNRQGLTGLPTEATLIDRLKKAMNTDFVVGEYPGIFSIDFVPGKNTVVTDLTLNVVTAAGGALNGAGTFDFIKEQIEANEDVEMRIQYTGDGGHWVTVAGWFDDGTTERLKFKDPLTGGTTVDSYEIVGTTIKNYKYGNPATISFAVSESITGVGGIAEVLVGGSDSPASPADGSGSSSLLYAAIVGGTAAAALAIAAGGWYARRRWLP